jgi:hypothetical protein
MVQNSLGRLARARQSRLQHCHSSGSLFSSLRTRSVWDVPIGDKPDRLKPQDSPLSEVTVDL